MEHRLSRAAAWLSVAWILGSTGCRNGWAPLDLSSVQQARAGFQEYYERYPIGQATEAAPAPKPSGSVIIGELIAIFPGLIVPGLGHYYAGDYKTAGKLLRIGETGYVLGAIGGGLCAGAYFLDEEDEDDDWQGMVYSLYGTGGVIAAVGLGYLLSAWVYDMIDTPRAVSSGGMPPPRTPFVESMDIFD